MTDQEKSWEDYRIAEHVDKAPAKYRLARTDKSVPWETDGRKTRQAEKGEPKWDEQRPKWKGEPPLALPSSKK